MNPMIEALEQLEQERGVSREVMFMAIEDCIKTACAADIEGVAKKDKEKEDAVDQIDVVMDRETGELHVYLLKEVVETVEKADVQLTLEEAKLMDANYQIGDLVRVEIFPKDFARKSAQAARGTIVQAITNTERTNIYEYFKTREGDIVTGIVNRTVRDSLAINLEDKTEVLLRQAEMVPGEHYNRGDRLKVYVARVSWENKGPNPKIIISRSHAQIINRLFEKEVSEIADGTVEIVSSCREAGDRSKIAVWSNDPDVDPVGACVGMNGSRVNNVVDELNGEKIDIICWDENPAIFIKNALSPAEVIAVDVDLDEKSAFVVVPDYQLSLAIGKKGQNARLAAKLTNYKIDIKSESQAEEMGYFDESDDYDEEYYDEEYEGEYEEGEYADQEYAEDYAEEEVAEEEIVEETEVTPEEDSTEE